MDRSEKKTAGPRPLYLYALPPDLLDVLAVKDGPQQQDGRALDEREATPRSVPLDGAQGSLSCSLCDQVFAALDEQKNHVRSDWHRYNLRQRLRGGRPVAEAEFEKLIGGAFSPNEMSEAFACCQPSFDIRGRRLQLRDVPPLTLLQI